VTPRLTGADDRALTTLSEALAAEDAACLLLRGGDGAVRAAADRLRAAAHERDIALLIEDRVELAAALQVDGVHLAAASGYAAARRRLGADGIVGATCASRHDAMELAEAGADYVVFGDVDGPAPAAETRALVEWWSELMTVPCVAAPCATPADRAALAAIGADFVAVLPDFLRAGPQ
jgi:thiamine-phosphate pyrophosphorylase